MFVSDVVRKPNILENNYYTSYGINKSKIF